MKASAALLLALSVTPAFAIQAVSRFDAGTEGWTLEGPGTLEWVAVGGNSAGHLKVTRTGPGEVYLVAPASFHGNWQSAGTTPILRHQLVLNFRSDAQPNRGNLYEVSGPAGTAVRDNPILCGSGTWNDIALWSYEASPVFENVRRLRIRLGMAAATPVGEVMLIDNIQFRSCVANCDGSTVSPTLTANDFLCFLQAVVNRDPYANMNGHCGTQTDDFIGFVMAYNTGCLEP